MRSYEHGHVTFVEEEELAAALEADTAAGALELVVDSARHFDIRGGFLLAGSQRRRYTAVDKHTRVVTLSRALTADLEAGDTIAVWDRDRGTVAVEKTARVALADGMSDDVYARVAHSVVDKLPAGPRMSGSEESVLLEQDAPGIWRLFDVLGVGDPDAALYRYCNDAWTVETAGDQVFRLGSRPLASSVRVYVNGDEVDEEDGWFIRGRRLSIDDALVAVGDEVVVDYVCNPPEEVLWEKDDAYTLTAADVTAGSFTFQLSHIPIEESVQAAWGGVTQAPTEYGVDEDGLVTWPLEGFELAGDVFSFHYQYLQGVAEPTSGEPEPLTLVPHTGYSVFWEPSSLAFLPPEYEATPEGMPLPEGTQLGDLLVVIAHTPNNGGKNDTILDTPFISGDLEPRLSVLHHSLTGIFAWGRITTLEPLKLGGVPGCAAVVATFGSSDGSQLYVRETFAQTVSVDDEGHEPGNTVISTAPPFDWRAVVLCAYGDNGYDATPPLFPGWNAMQAAGHETRMQWWNGEVFDSSPGAYWETNDYQVYDHTLWQLGLSLEPPEV